MTYEQARACMARLQKKGSIYGLDAVGQLAGNMGNPQKEIPVIQIVGTNGKGSVGTMLAAMLACAGYKVGRFTSPAVLEERESITFTVRDLQFPDKLSVNMISEKEYAHCFSGLKDAMEKMKEETMTEPTAFEVETVMAFAMFVQWKCDVAIVEAGLGGEDDATNIVRHPLMTVITDISMDHMQLLGNSLEEIARKKAGIIKPGSKVVTVMQEPEVMRVLYEISADRNSKMIIADEKNVTGERYGLNGDSFIYMDSRGGRRQYRMQMHGTYQVRNSIIALEAALLMDEGAGHITGQNRAEGLYLARWKGRFDVVSENPLVIADGAHNAGAAKALAHSVEQYLKGKSVIGITGMFQDKECDLVMKMLAPHMEQIYTVTAPADRGMDAGKLLRIAKKYCSHAESCETVEAALAMAEKLEMKEKAILVFGSLSILKDVYRRYQDAGGGHIFI